MLADVERDKPAVKAISRNRFACFGFLAVACASILYVLLVAAPRYGLLHELTSPEIIGQGEASIIERFGKPTMRLVYSDDSFHNERVSLIYEGPFGSSFTATLEDGAVVRVERGSK